jgi:hypothetical protein
MKFKTLPLRASDQLRAEFYTVARAELGAPKAADDRLTRPNSA